jgi:hypothetical protein
MVCLTVQFVVRLPNHFLHVAHVIVLGRLDESVPISLQPSFHIDIPQFSNALLDTVPLRRHRRLWSALETTDACRRARTQGCGICNLYAKSGSGVPSIFSVAVHEGCRISWI